MFKTIRIYAVALFLLPLTARGEGTRDSLKDLSLRYGFPSPRQSYSNITLSAGCSTLSFEMNGRKLLFNGVLIWMNDPLSGNGSGWSVDKSDVTRIIDPLLRADRALMTTGKTVVVIDPGHGGTDSGTMGQKLPEKRAALDIAKRVQERLRGLNIEAQLTRDTDMALTLGERSAAARKQGATLFLSIHMNSAANAGAAGIETYVLTAPGFASTAGENGKSGPEPGNRFDAGSHLLAYEVHRAVLAQTGSNDRGIKHARFDVLTQASCPALLIECGFLSNAYEETMISMKTYRDMLAEGIANGVMAYISDTGTSR